jgi:hypothetical protein
MKTIILFVLILFIGCSLNIPTDNYSHDYTDLYLICHGNVIPYYIIDNYKSKIIEINDVSTDINNNNSYHGETLLTPLQFSTKYKILIYSAVGLNYEGSGYLNFKDQIIEYTTSNNKIEVINIYLDK